MIEQKAKHTPGPWKASWYSVISVRKDQRTTTLIAKCRISERRKEEAKGNARLIAAAPDLLAACEIALDRLRIADEDRSISADFEIDTLEAAIAKAKGE